MSDKKLTMGQMAALMKAASAKVDLACDRRVRTLAQIGVGLVKMQIEAMHAVDTSTMLNSTVADSVGEHAVLIGPTTDYAVYVALGTSRMAARPFHVKAAQELAKQAKEDFNLDLGV